MKFTSPWCLSYKFVDKRLSTRYNSCDTVSHGWQIWYVATITTTITIRTTWAFWNTWTMTMKRKRPAIRKHRTTMIFQTIFYDKRARFQQMCQPNENKKQKQLYQLPEFGATKINEVELRNFFLEGLTKCAHFQYANNFFSGQENKFSDYSLQQIDNRLTERTYWMRDKESEEKWLKLSVLGKYKEIWSHSAITYNEHLFFINHILDFVFRFDSLNLIFYLMVYTLPSFLLVLFYTFWLNFQPFRLYTIGIRNPFVRKRKKNKFIFSFVFFFIYNLS